MVDTPGPKKIQLLDPNHLTLSTWILVAHMSWACLLCMEMTTMRSKPTMTILMKLADQVRITFHFQFYPFFWKSLSCLANYKRDVLWSEFPFQPNFSHTILVTKFVVTTATTVPTVTTVATVTNVTIVTSVS